jgi:hypothetical protein
MRQRFERVMDAVGRQGEHVLQDLSLVRSNVNAAGISPKGTPHYLDRLFVIPRVLVPGLIEMHFIPAEPATGQTFDPCIP